ncbi:PREDICTED: HAUS augmin-like complex subunit 1, partial [Pterocles gutturalis]
QVTLWLKKIYGNQPVPEYEVNANTVDILYELAECNEARDRDVSLLIEDMEQKATEYKAEANYLKDLLAESLGLSLSSLSSEGTSYLDVLADSAVILETKDTSLASLFCAINDMTSELYATESKNREITLELSNICQNLSAKLMWEKQLMEDLKKVEELNEIEKATDESKSQNLKFLKSKTDDLQTRIKAAEEQLVAREFDPSLTHKSLVNLSEKLAALKEEIVSLKKEIGVFLDLTPNPSLAQLKIEEAKQELEALESELSKEVDMLTLEIPEPSKLQFK